MARPTWSGSLSGTFRAHTCALETRGTSGATDRSLMSLSETSLGVSPCSAPSSPTSPTPMSSGPLSLGPPARSWCTSLGVGPPQALVNCSTSPPTLPRAKRQLGQSSSMATPRGSRKPRPLRPQAPNTLKRRKRVARGSRAGRTTTSSLRQIARTPSGLLLGPVSSTRC